MGRNTKTGQKCKPAVKSNNIEMREILEKVIEMRKVNDLSLKEIANKFGKTDASLYYWLDKPEFKDLKEKFDSATLIGEYNSNDAILADAKTSMRDLIKGKDVVESTKEFKFDGKKKVLVKQYDKSKHIEPDFETIKFVVQHLSPIYSSTSVNNVINIFMQFNDYVKDIDPILAARIGELQTTFLSLSVNGFDNNENK